jgi:hypothetical protein
LVSGWTDALLPGGRRSKKKRGEAGREKRLPEKRVRATPHDGITTR